MKFSNIWKGWITTLLGILITTATAVATSYSEGAVNWDAVKAVAIPALLLALTDGLRQQQKRLLKQNNRHARPKSSI